MEFHFAVIFLLLLFVQIIAAKPDMDVNETQNEKTEEQKKGKILSLFSVVTFKNSGCRSSTNQNGTCYTSSECTNKGGNANGNCASGFGVCCVFTVSASGSTISQNCTYIQNPGYPSALTTTSAISYTITKCTTGVCYLRLDFQSFTLLGPSDTVIGAIAGTSSVAEIGGGVCADTFQATGSTGVSIPVICGQNTGQHMYINVGGATSDTGKLDFTFGTAASTSRKWQIKVTQIPCASAVAPPTGCLQYQYASSGRLSTFNFQDTAGQHLRNQLYQVCIRPEAGMCCIRYQVCPDQTNAFSLSSGLLTGDSGKMSQIDTQCSATHDYVLIEGASSVCGTSSTTLHSKFCGLYLNTDNMAIGVTNIPICDCTAPFRVGFYTNAVSDTGIAVATDTGNTAPSRGTCLDYTQIPCGTSQ